MAIDTWRSFTAKPPATIAELTPIQKDLQLLRIDLARPPRHPNALMDRVLKEWRNDLSDWTFEHAAAYRRLMEKLISEQEK